MPEPLLTWHLPVGKAPRVRSMGVVRHTAKGERRVDVWRQPTWGFAILHGYGRIELRERNWAMDVVPGSAGIFPPGETLTISMEEHWVQHECYFDPAPGAQLRPVRPVVRLSTNLGALDAALMAGMRAYSEEPGSATAAVWHLLWQLCRLSTLSTAAGTEMHPALARAVSLIDEDFDGKHSVALLAKAVNVSTSTLNRLFRGHFGHGPLAHQQQRRVERARHLLQHTCVPIKEVAAQLAFDNLHAFNKFVRLHLKASPRAVRHGP